MNLQNQQSSAFFEIRFTATLTVALLISAATASAQQFILRHTFDDPTPSSPGLFGQSVALDGNYVLISAEGADTNAGERIGEAHLFDISGDLLQTFDDPTPFFGGDFGSSVALDGNQVLIGDRQDNTNGEEVGQAHLFDASSGNLLHTFDDPTVTDQDWFGHSVALDGDRVLIGAQSDDTYGDGVGQAHLFDASSGNLLHTFDDPTVTDRDRFGASVSLDGDRLLIGAFRDDTNGTDVGQAHLFDATSRDLLQTFDDPTPPFFEDFFGRAVALDGNYVLIGGRNSVHLFDAGAGLLWTFDDPTPGGWAGFSDSVALDGGRVLIGDTSYVDPTYGNRVGRAYLFDAGTGNLLQTFDNPFPDEWDEFGNSVALDGNRILIGTPGDGPGGDAIGTAYLFTEIPEPGIGVLLMAALVGLAALRQR